MIDSVYAIFLQL